MAAISMENEVHEAAKKFEAEFEFSKMETMIHRFPAALGDALRIRYKYMVVPRFVAIGPYHHGKKHLEKMEEVKKAATYYLRQRVEFEPEQAMNEMLAIVVKARDKYYHHHHDETGVDDVEGEAGTGILKDDRTFAAMMFRDACFLLLYMDMCSRSYGNKRDHEVNESMRRFLFSNRDSINSDIMLLENQLPWLVIQALLRAVSQEQKRALYMAVGVFITAIGDSFTISQGWFELYKWDDENNPPAHLLALLRRYKTESESDQIISISISGAEQDRAMSPMELEEIGIKLTPSQTAAFSDVRLQKGRLNFLWDLALPPLFFNDTVASCLVNMAALEVCTASRFGDRADRTAVCSYVALLAFFMIGAEDVRRLRSMHLLDGAHSHEDMRAFFNTVAKHLPDRGYNFYLLMGQINQYRKNSRRIAIYKWFHKNYMTIIKVMSVVGTIIGLYQGLRSLVHKT